MARYFIKHPSIWIILLIRLREEEERGKVPFFSHHTKDTCYHHDMIIDVTWLRQCLSGFNTVKLLFYSISTLCYFGGSRYVYSILKGICSLSLRTGYLCILFCFFSPPPAFSLFVFYLIIHCFLPVHPFHFCTHVLTI